MRGYVCERRLLLQPPDRGENARGLSENTGFGISGQSKAERVDVICDPNEPVGLAGSKRGSSLFPFLNPNLMMHEYSAIERRNGSTR